MKNIFNKLLTNLAKCFTGYNILFHLVAFGLTFFLITSGFDWFYLQHTRNHYLQLFFAPSTAIGIMVSIGLPIILYFVGKQKQNPRILNAAFAVIQGTIIYYIIFVFYKGITGRVAPPILDNVATSTILNFYKLIGGHVPPLLNATSPIDTSHIFNFGFIKQGISWGWPSGHTMAAVAKAVILSILFKENKKLRYLLILYAAYMGLGMSVTLHWFSDVVSGALIGIAIGLIVGRSFLNIHPSTPLSSRRGAGGEVPLAGKLL